MHFFPETNALIDLDHYSAYDFTKKLKLACSIETIKPILTTKGYAQTHTAANLVLEMDRMRVSRSWVLAIDRGKSKNSEDLLAVANKNNCLDPFVSIEPRSKTLKEHLTALIESGARGIKIHPPMQTVRPNHPGICMVLEIAGQFHIPVLYHCGYSPLMPKFERRFCAMNDYKDAVEKYPNTTIILGHAGINQYQQVIDIMNTNTNVYAELSGQPPGVIQMFIQKTDTDRLLFGSDWPYYPIALPLAKVLLATEGINQIREKILYKNAQRVLSLIKNASLITT